MTSPARPRAGKRDMVNTFDPRSGVELPEEDRHLLARRRATLGDLYPLFYQRPVHVVAGSGAHLRGPDGEDYLDCYNNVACVGHANPRVRDAVSAQLARADTHTRYLQDEVVSYAERILATYPDEIDRVAFTNSGSESNDLAIRMARVATGHRGVVVTGNAYHGVTDLIASMSPSMGPSVPQAPFVRAVPVIDLLRNPAPDAAERLLARYEAAFDDLHDAGYGLSAVLLDQILSSDGILPEPRGWVARLAQLAHDRGGLLVADEVQSGFARTGDAFWGFARHGADADLVSMGKPMGNGIPTGGVAYKSWIGDAFGASSRYFNTFGGNPVSMVAAGAVLDDIEDRGLQEHVRVTGARIVEELRRLLGDRPAFGGVRGAGFFIGLDIVRPDDGHTPDPDRTLAIVNALRERRVLLSASGAPANTVKIRPPLVFTDADVDRLLDVLSALADHGLFG